MRYMFRVKDRTRRAANDMIVTMAKHGNHDYRFSSDADVKRFFAAGGYDFAHVVRASRAPNSTVPLVENLVPGTWSVTGGATVTIVDSRTGVELTEVQGPGTYSPYEYWGRFEDAVRDLHQCLEHASLGEFKGCVSCGLASLEAYMAHRAWLHNSAHPQNQLVGGKHHPVSFDKKVDEWIPAMSGGRKLDKGSRNWADLKALRKFRNEVAIHPKGPPMGMDYGELSCLLNLFRSGIAGLLTDLHLHFRERIPCIIVRYAFLGDIELVGEEEV